MRFYTLFYTVFSCFAASMRSPNRMHRAHAHGCFAPFWRPQTPPLSALKAFTEAFYALGSLLCALRIAECGKPEKSLAVAPEARPRRSHHICFFKQHIKKLPRSKPSGAFKPDIRRIYAPGKPYAALRQRTCYNPGILFVIAYVFLYLFLSFSREYSFRAALNDIRNAVEFSCLSPEPKLWRSLLSDVHRHLGYEAFGKPEDEY